MKTLIFSLFFGFGTLTWAEPRSPRLFFSYSYLYDSICGQAPGKNVQAAWSEEADQRTPQFEAWWRAEEATLTHELFKLYGLGFSRTELTATLSACPRSSSTSDPLVLVVNRYLKTYHPEFPSETRGFIFADQVFHELLHNWLGEHRPETTRLLEKYKNEEQIVKNHLHLMAMQKDIYTELGRTDLLLWLEQQYSRGPDPAYRRAWEIVNRLEGYQSFVFELKK